MYVTADGDRAFLQQDISMTGHLKQIWLSIVYVPLVGHLTRPVALREPTQVQRQPWSPNMHIMHLETLRRTLSHSLCTSFSASCLQFIKLSIHPSSVGMDAGSVAGESLWGSGNLPMSTSIFESILASVRGGQ